MSLLSSCLWVGLGGFAGAVARFLTAVLVTRWLGLESFLATASANMLGCFAIGAAVTWLESRTVDPGELRLLVVVGFLGAYTTFSTFGLESLDLTRSGRGSIAVANLLLQPALGLGLALLGRNLALSILAR
jgi:CrcB protein